MPSSLSPRLYLHIVHITLLLTFLLILAGGATRVFDAGVSCPDWPHCYGFWWPWPESRLLNAGLPGYIVDGTHYAWWQVFLEWSHRGLAALVGVGVLALLALAKPLGQPGRVWAPLATITALLLVQIGLGGVTVKLENIHWSVAMHLGCAMLIFAALVWLRRMVALGSLPLQPLPTPAKTLPLTILLAVTVWATMLMGAMVSSSHAGGVCGGLFSCDGSWFPADTLQHWHMLHRFLALSVAVLSIVPLVRIKKAMRTAFRPEVLSQLAAARKMFLHIHLMIWGQVALGVATLYSFTVYPALYPLLSVAHLGWGTLVLLTVVGAALTLRVGLAGRFHAA